MADDQSRLAERVGTLRKRKGWTVTETARRAGMSTSMLWKVENNQTSLTYKKLMQLADALEVHIGELFAVEASEVTPTGRRVVNRKGDSPMVDFGGNLHYFLAADIAKKHYFPIVVDVGARADTDKPPEAHSGEEFAYVIEGVIEFRCEGYSPARLEAGDSVYFDASLKHRYICAEGDIARMICVYSNAQAVHGVASSGHAEAHSRAMQIFTKAGGKTRAAAGAGAAKPAAARAKRRRS